jgi:hypothetical protein
MDQFEYEAEIAKLAAQDPSLAAILLEESDGEEE